VEYPRGDGRGKKPSRKFPGQRAELVGRERGTILSILRLSTKGEEYQRNSPERKKRGRSTCAFRGPKLADNLDKKAKRGMAREGGGSLASVRRRLISTNRKRESWQAEGETMSLAAMSSGRCENRVVRKQQGGLEGRTTVSPSEQMLERKGIKK